MNESVFLLVTAVIFLIIGFLTGTVLAKRKAREWHERSSKAQRTILGGKFSEHIATLLPGFPADLKASEARFIGDPIDFVFFRGKDEHKIDEIVFLEVKSGEAHLSDIEDQLKDAVQRGRVRWEEYRIPKEVTREIRNPNS